MSLLMWNCQETKCSSSRIDSLKRRFDLNGISVPSRGKGGGLALLWPKAVSVALQTYSLNHIDVSVQLEDSGDCWRFTGVYGEPDTQQRQSTWDLLARLHSQSHQVWLCAGDFNEILDQSKKSGGQPRPNWQIQNFRRALDNCELVDIGCTGSPFTWSNRHCAPNTVLERLDRACANVGWTQLFPKASVKHESVNCSDHSALIIRLVDKPEYATRHTQPWRFEAAWLQSDQCAKVVENSWNSCLGMPAYRGYRNRLHAVKRTLVDGANPCFGVIKTRSNGWKRDLGGRASGLRQTSLEEFETLGGLGWRQRTALNSAFLLISEKCTNPFRPQPDDIARGTEHLRSMVDANMGEELLQLYTASEVEKTLSQMAPLKSPRPDANRLKVFLEKIISPAQSAFVLGRLIFDNILLAFELNHFLNAKTRGEQGWMALKLDVSKAYDKVEWLFLEQNAEREGHIWGIAICRGAPTISHLLFANDTLIFCQASLDASRVIRELLETYRKASGQEINFSKSSVAFSRNTRETLCQYLATEFTIRRKNRMELYLGLPSTMARSKRELFSTIRDKIWRRIFGGMKSSSHRLAKRLCESKLVGGLGFRHLHLFNLAMLAKQLWHILRYPEESLSRVLRARLSSVQDAGGVGTGSCINVWSDPWLPRSRSFRPITPVPVELSHLRLDDLVDPRTIPLPAPVNMNKLGGGNYGKRGFQIRLRCLCGGLAVTPSPQVPASGWSAPPDGCVKINFDGATFKHGQELGVGVIARGASGECLAWLNWRVQRLGDGEMAEALAARAAVLLARRKGWNEFMFFQWVRRSRNQIAHFLAQSARSYDEGDVVAPPAVAFLVIADCFG
ncbi:UNVERIFIED_CONTAM: hypothetical protein Slati_2890200 [Sesamum latifolium]|uniref:Endonuclease/exonuclease/phosphatase domain-containing protein n=1 Tax=Sesamum latifolium TaxID=2727402 RepID=A0AAW2VDV0_9LAMI